jgi:prepilin-type N-terminal cleavage/methylation domain-containing protein
MKLRSKFRRNLSTQAGFSLLELTIAVSILAVGILGGMGVICAATATNGNSKINTSAAMVAQSTMEKILAAGPAATTSLTDCAGNSFPVNTALGGSAVTTGMFSGVDYTQPAVPNYSMLYITCSGLNLDVRWRIDAGPTPSTQLITVSVKGLRSAANPAAGLVRRFTLRTVRGS